MKKKFLPVLLAVALMMGGCSAKAREDIEVGEANEGVVEEFIIDDETEESEANDSSLSEEPANSEEEVTSEEASKDTSELEYKTLSQEEIEAIKPNEMGEVMVIMYHGITSKNSTYTRTAESFRADLEELYEMGFRAISLRDFVSGNITTEAGYTPVVFTFDDGNQSNFNLIEDADGNLIIDPDSAVGILENFYEKHPDFGLEATFFLNAGIPFGQEEYVDYKLKYLVDRGMDFGNHSYGHEHFKDLDTAGIEKSLGKNKAQYMNYIEGYEFNLLALPFGERPKSEEAKEKLKKGSYEGIEYENIAILNVGWRPSYSSYSASFDQHSILRVQSGDGPQQMRDYLDAYYKSPSLRFISDGNPKTITVPERRAGKLKESLLEKFEVITYNDNK